MLATNPHLRVRQAELKIAPQGPFFSYREACRIAGEAIGGVARTVLIDLGCAEDATTSAFAQLVILRRKLREIGRDLCLTGLRDRTAGLYEVNRLAAVLPRV